MFWLHLLAMLVYVVAATADILPGHFVLAVVLALLASLQAATLRFVWHRYKDAPNEAAREVERRLTEGS